jgi:hypothetical protein
LGLEEESRILDKWYGSQELGKTNEEKSGIRNLKHGI